MPSPVDPLEPTEVVDDASAAAGGGRLMVVWEGGAVTRELPARGRLVIGRSPESDVRVDHVSVSRQHAALEVDGARVTIEDMGSANGTTVRGERLRRGDRRSVASGESVAVGTTHLVVTTTADRRDVPAAARGGARVVVGPTMRALFDGLEPIAMGELSILLLGETGVGKDVIAARIHATSQRRGGPFLRLNCAAFPDALLESELFGHERGAFTGAQSAKMGLFEAATGGTVLLDELAELTVTMQSKLLRALEDREVQRIGALKPRPIDVRFLGATSRNLDALIAEGRFRADLYYRIGGAVVRVPPLRERREEIVALAEAFVAATFERTGRGAPPALSAEVRERLVAHDWPGNIRELRNVVERATLMSRGETIATDNLVFDPRGASGAWPSLAPPSSARLPAAPSSAPAPFPSPASRPEAAPLRDDIDALERRRILETLEQCGGNQTRAAKALGISRRTLLSRLDAYGVPRPRK